MEKTDRKFGFEDLLNLGEIFYKASRIPVVFLDETQSVIGEIGFEKLRQNLNLIYPKLFNLKDEYLEYLIPLLINVSTHEHLDRNRLYSRLFTLKLNGKKIYVLVGNVFVKNRFSKAQILENASIVGLDCEKIQKVIENVMEVDETDIQNLISYYQKIVEISDCSSRLEPEFDKTNFDEKQDLLTFLAICSWQLDLSETFDITSSWFSPATSELTQILRLSENPIDFLNLIFDKIKKIIDLLPNGQRQMFVFSNDLDNPIGKWLEHKVLISKDRTGNIKLLGITQDISNRITDEQRFSLFKKRDFELAEFLPQTIYETDSAGHIVYMNKAGKKIFGYAESVIKKGFDHRRLLSNDNDKMSSEKMIRTILTGKQCPSQEFEAIDNNGRKFPVIIHASPIISKGICRGCRGLIIDISKRKLVEQAMEISLEKYRVLFETFPIGIAITDKQGNLIEVNPTSEKIFGLSMSELLKRRHDSPDWSVIYPDGSPMHSDNFASVKAQKENAMVEVYESGIIHNDGSITWVNTKAAPIPLGNLGVASAYTDITERHLTKKALVMSETKWRTLAENAPDIIITTDRQGKILYSNRPMGEIPVELLLGSSVFNWTVSENEQEFRACFEECARSKQTGKTECPSISTKGKKQWFSIHIGPIVHADEVTGFTLIFSNITEQKEIINEKREMEIKLMASSKLATLGEMATGMAHEINQPLNFISVFLQLLDEDLDSDNLNIEELRKNLNNSLHSIRRITTIIDHLRVFGRAHSEVIEAIYLSKLFDNVLILFSERLKRSKISVHIELPSELSPVLANSNKLEQVFVNLIQNAVDVLVQQESHRGINIEVQEKNDNILIVFTDNGNGMPDAHLSRIFEPFFTTKDPGEGTGLGLSIVYGIIKDFGGKISVESTLGEGSIFKIELPIWRQDEGI